VLDYWLLACVAGDKRQFDEVDLLDTGRWRMWVSRATLYRYRVESLVT
jgi:hypothetical protein